jgi:hypothetical protein
MKNLVRIRALLKNISILLTLVIAKRALFWTSFKVEEKSKMVITL